MRRDRIVRGFLRHRLVVTMKNGATWDGVLIDSDDRTISLRDAVAIDSDRNRVPADGEILLNRTDIAFAQYVPVLQP